MRTTGVTGRATTPPARTCSKPVVTASSVSGIGTSGARASKHSCGAHSRGLPSFPLSRRERGTGGEDQSPIGEGDRGGGPISDRRGGQGVRTNLRSERGTGGEDQSPSGEGDRGGGPIS